MGRVVSINKGLSIKLPQPVDPKDDPSRVTRSRTDVRRRTNPPCNQPLHSPHLRILHPPHRVSRSSKTMVAKVAKVAKVARVAKEGKEETVMVAKEAKEAKEAKVANPFTVDSVAREAKVEVDFSVAPTTVAKVARVAKDHTMALSWTSVVNL